MYTQHPIWGWNGMGKITQPKGGVLPSFDGMQEIASQVTKHGDTVVVFSSCGMCLWVGRVWIICREMGLMAIGQW